MSVSLLKISAFFHISSIIMSYNNQTPDMLNISSVPCEDIFQQLKDLPDTHLWPGDAPALNHNSEPFYLEPNAPPCIDDIPNCHPHSIELSSGSIPCNFHNETNKRDIQLSFEEELLLTLRDERSKTWKEISATFENVFGGRYRPPAMQMRYLRLHKRLRLSIDDDVSALFQAYSHWVDMKWDVISERVLSMISTICQHSIVLGF